MVDTINNDIDMVMENQTDNVEAIKKLRTVGVVKG